MLGYFLASPLAQSLIVRHAHLQIKQFLQLSDAPSQREAAIKKYGKKIVSVMV
jgi:hypothetical protein